MAIITNRPISTGFNAATLFNGLVGRFAAWNDTRVTRNALNTLTDRELDDLGLIRSDIEGIAQGVRR